MRRALVPAAILLAAIVTLASPVVADQMLRDGVHSLRALHPTSRPGTVPVAHGPRAGQWAEPAGPITPMRPPVVAATDNGNTTYGLDVRYAPGTCADGLLSLAGDVTVAGSYGSGTGECSLWFTLTEAQATQAATHFGVPRQDRSPIGQSLRGTFAPAQPTYSRGQSIEVVLTIAAPSTGSVVRFQRGGRQRGPRDNQFSFVLTRDGQPLAPVDAMDFGGLSALVAVPLGGSVEVRAPLASWGDVSVPGHYEVQCRYETQLALDGVDVYEPAHRGEVWDRAFTGTITFDVR